MVRFISQPTPNPNSIKITQHRGSFISSGLLAFSSSEEAEEHPLARALFELRGVTNVLILPEFITITKDSSGDWRSLWTQIENALRRYYSVAE